MSLGLNQVLVRMSTSGVCYSDLHYMLNDTPAPPMSKFGVVSAGHEGCGVVVKLGPSVQNLEVGSRVGIKPIWTTCGSCDRCWGDMETHCAKKVNTGLGVAGTFQHYMVADASHAIPIPEGVSDELAATLMCSAATAYRSVKSAGLPPGSDVVVLGGGGGVGIQVIQVAKLFGFRTVAVDVGDSKRDLALEMGADHFVDAGTAADPVAEAVRLTDGGAHGVFVTAPLAYKHALDYVGSRVGGVVMCIGLPAAGSGHHIVANPGLLILKHLSIKGSLVGTREDTNTVLKYAQRGLIKPFSQSIRLEDLPDKMQVMKEGKQMKKLVVNFDL